MPGRVGEILTRVPGRLTLDGTAKEAIETARQRIAFAGALFALLFLIVTVRLFDVTVLQEPRESRPQRTAPASTTAVHNSPTRSTGRKHSQPSSPV